MAAATHVRRPAHKVRIIKYLITLGAVVLTSLGALALSDERALASTSQPTAQSIPAQIGDGARDLLAPLVAWAAEPSAALTPCDATSATH